MLFQLELIRRPILVWHLLRRVDDRTYDHHEIDIGTLSMDLAYTSAHTMIMPKHNRRERYRQRYIASYECTDYVD